jgi:nucleoside-diphosphate-sugar epimerase
MNIFLTGVTGFVGQAIAMQLAKSPNIKLSVVARTKLLRLPIVAKVYQVNNLDGDADLQDALTGIDVVIHAAARVHVMNEAEVNSLDNFRKVNVEGTLNLARQSIAAGVRRFIFISSIKVNGDSNEIGMPYTADDEPAPTDSYGMSKLEAEVGLREMALNSGMEVVIVRPPLVYGSGVRANFASMLYWISSGVPLPLGAVNNARSLVALDNLVDFVITCLKHPAAAGQTFLVSDGEDVSTSELLRRTAAAMGKTTLLLPVPVTWLKLIASLLGKREIAQRLLGSLTVDIEKNRVLLGWRPPLTLNQGLKKTVEGMKR